MRCNERLQEAEGEGGRRARLRLLDLFLWLHHVAPQASKGGVCSFSIHSEDRRRTPARPPRRSGPPPPPPKAEVEYVRRGVVGVKGCFIPAC